MLGHSQLACPFIAVLLLMHWNLGREIYRNETDASARGSLIWVLDRTVTRFGARLLKSWVGRPLVDKTCVLPMPVSIRVCVAVPSN